MHDDDLIMKARNYALAGLIAVGASTVFGQTEISTEANTNSRVETQTVTGRVREYEPGWKIVLGGPYERSYSFDLDGSVKVDGVVLEGQTARVEYTRDKDGRQRVTVISAVTRETAAGS